MAASKKRTAARKKTTAKRSSSGRPAAKKKAGTRSRKSSSIAGAVMKSRLFLVCLILLTIAVSLITLLRLGAAGAFLYGLLSLVMGSFAIVFLIAVIAGGFWLIWTGGNKKLPLRFSAGLVVLLVSWGMMAALPSIPEGDPWMALSLLQDEMPAILAGEAVTNCGYIGAVVSGISVSLFAKPGSWILAWTLLLISLAALGGGIFEEAAELMKENSKKALQSFSEKRQESAEIRRQNREQSILQENARLQQQELLPETEPFSFERAASLLEQTDASAGGKAGRPKKKSLFARLQSNEFFEGGKTGGKGKSGKNSGKSTGADMLHTAAELGKAFQENAVPASLLEQASSLLPDEVSIQIGGQASPGSGRQQEAKPARQADFSGGKSASGSAGKASRKEKESAAVVRPSEQTAQAGSRMEQKPLDDLIQNGKKKAAGNRNMIQVSSDEPEELRLADAIASQYDSYKLPKLSLLNEPSSGSRSVLNTQTAKENGARLIQILQQFNVPAVLTEIHIGPSVTKFEISPGVGVRVNTITNLQNDIKMALAATDIRIEAPIPGKSAVGIEVPNPEKTEVSMKELMRKVPEKLSRLPLVFGLGKDLLGENVYGRLDTMPHLLIAGATGSGKSVCVNSIICSILMRTKPDEVKMILVDPKKVEFTPYNDVPHLLAPVITDGELANKALKVVVEMMDARYDLFEEARVRNINSYNAFVDQHPDSHLRRLPRIVVIIDELADLMLVGAKEVEQSIQRITQLARAAGIHLIVATQRPSVNVITGVIKANIPARIAFAVSSTVDSRTILDQAGAERLLGYGDMLFLDNGDSAPRRIQGVFIKDEEVNAVAGYVKGQGTPQYDDAFITLRDLQGQGTAAATEADDPLYDQIKHFVITSRKASTSLIQRRFSIGYARAARVIDTLELNGIIGPANGSKPREILVQNTFEDLDA